MMDTSATTTTTEDLYPLWHDRMVDYFALSCRSHEAEDLAQDVFVRYLQPLCRGETIRDPERWLWRVARNLVFDRYRHYGRRPGVVDVDVSEVEVEDPRQPDPQEWVCRRDTAADAMEALLCELTDAQRGVLALRYGEGLGHRDVACRLGISVPASKARQRRALARLRVVMCMAGRGWICSITKGKGNGC